jgi:hypothetical protein
VAAFTRCLLSRHGKAAEATSRRLSACSPFSPSTSRTSRPSQRRPRLASGHARHQAVSAATPVVACVSPSPARGCFPTRVQPGWRQEQLPLPGVWSGRTGCLASARASAAASCSPAACSASALKRDVVVDDIGSVTGPVFSTAGAAVRAAPLSRPKSADADTSGRLGKYALNPRYSRRPSLVRVISPRRMTTRSPGAASFPGEKRSRRGFGCRGPSRGSKPTAAPR